MAREDSKELGGKSRGEYFKYHTTIFNNDTFYSRSFSHDLKDMQPLSDLINALVKYFKVEYK